MFLSYVIHLSEGILQRMTMFTARWKVARPYKNNHVSQKIILDLLFT